MINMVGGGGWGGGQFSWGEIYGTWHMSKVTTLFFIQPRMQCFLTAFSICFARERVSCNVAHFW
jgi:hypothetical protein